MPPKPPSDILPLGERLKLLVDLYKHLTTIAIGLIVATGTVVEKYFTSATWRILIPSSLALLLISVLSGIVGIFFTIGYAASDEGDRAWDTGFTISLLVSLVTFIAAVVCIGVFMGRNVW